MSKTKLHKIIAVTPAGRKRYLEILSRYILSDDSIDEWHLWDNCREQSDREYIYRLSKENKKIYLIKENNVDGTNRSVNKFYKYCMEEKAFYIKIDDDIVYLPTNFGMKLYSRAIQEKNKYTWWSPLVINNAICTYLLNALGIIKTKCALTAQASCPIGWGSPFFAGQLHKAFIKSVKSMKYNKWKLSKDYEIFLQRFSINTIGFFGDLCKKLGDKFCPADVDDEEYISATLPILTQKPGRLVCDIVVAHFSFYTQEHYLLKKTNILEEYKLLAGISTNSADDKQKSKIFHKFQKLIIYNVKYIMNEIFEFYLPQQSIKYKVNLNDDL